jgi:hypothetical protein
MTAVKALSRDVTENCSRKSSASVVPRTAAIITSAQRRLLAKTKPKPIVDSTETHEQDT